MANEKSDDGDRTEEAHQPRECMPCRGSGKVISNLGGEPSTVECPWCGGGGVRRPGTDAQAKWLDDAGAEQTEQPEVD
jgi:DnaJ-class molecular chaperone